jgi:hypothetical protein
MMRLVILSSDLVFIPVDRKWSIVVRYDSSEEISEQDIGTRKYSTRKKYIWIRISDLRIEYFWLQDDKDRRFHIIFFYEIFGYR